MHVWTYFRQMFLFGNARAVMNHELTPYLLQKPTPKRGFELLLVSESEETECTFDVLHPGFH
jgi:hypothetical protein